jgi:RES domain-containing protein
MRAFRIADRRFPIFDGTGARFIGGRWNSPGKSLIYSAETFAGAVLETLIHSNLGRMPKTHAVVEITIPETLAIEFVTAEGVRGWDAANFRVSRAFGDKWLTDGRTAVLAVPSMVTRGRERNILLNPEHPDFGQITVSIPETVHWESGCFIAAEFGVSGKPV